MRILSIDGGGIRGIIPGQILVVLEKLLQKYSGLADAKIADYFDMIAGTSTGGILTSIYLCPDKINPKRAKYSAADAVQLYTQNGRFIFNTSFFHKFFNLFGLFKPLYSADMLEELLNNYFGKVKVSELVKPCLITSYDIKSHSAIFFNKLSAIKNNNHDFLLKDIARATSAAPTYFPVANIKSINYLAYSLIDGGVFANNPALCAYAEASKLGTSTNLNDMLILSLGTGAYGSEYKYRNATNWGRIEWVIPIINVMMSGVSETVDYQLNVLFKSINKSDNYLRINPSLMGFGRSVYEMDNASTQNINLLKKIGCDTADAYFTRLDNFAKMLVHEQMK